MKSSKFFAFLTLMRPANIITAVADIMLGFAAAGGIMVVSNIPGFAIPELETLLWLVLATTGLYGGGVVMNDVFDLTLDQVERPERPIPSGRVTQKEATILGVFLLLGGILAANQVASSSTLIACLISIAALWYDAFGKHNNWFGPINMGICRGLNVLLGMSFLPLTPLAIPLFFIPVIYISGITTISRGEVHGNNRGELWIGLALYVVVIAIIAWKSQHLLVSLPFLILFGWMIFRPLLKAIRQPIPKLIGKSVKTGVLALIIMDATIAVGYSNWQFGIFMIILFPLSLFLARIFAVT